MNFVIFIMFNYQMQFQEKNKKIKFVNLEQLFFFYSKIINKNKLKILDLDSNISRVKLSSSQLRPNIDNK